MAASEFGTVALPSEVGMGQLVGTYAILPQNNRYVWALGRVLCEQGVGDYV